MSNKSLADFKTLEDLVSNAIPDGEYVIDLTDVSSGLTSQKKTPQVTFKYTEQSTGQKDYLHYYLTEGGLKVLGGTLRRCKVEGLTLPQYTEDDEVYAERWATTLTPMVGKSFRAKFTTETDNTGVQRNRVNIIDTADGAPLVLGTTNVI